LLDQKINISLRAVWCFKCNPFMAALLHGDRSLYLLCGLVPILMWLCMLAANDISLHVNS
jgi:hypothetical protein